MDGLCEGERMARFSIVKQLAYGAVTAALYTALTVAVAPIASGMLQCRISEALCVLPYFLPAAVPGLFVGCLISNLILGNMLLDVLLGSLATLLAAVCTCYMGTRGLPFYLAPLPGVVFNAFITGWVVFTLYMPEVPYWINALYVGAGQVLACYGLGLPLFLFLKKYQKSIFRA